MKMTLGAFIAQLRKEKGLTQKQLSEILGVSDKTVSHWEREESAPDISVLPLLAETLGVTVDELLAGEIKSEELVDSSVSDTASTVENKENDFYKFKQKSTVVSLLSIVLGLSGTTVLSLLSNTFSFTADFHYTAKIVSAVLLAVNMIAQGALVIYARTIYSGYVNKHNDKKSASRLATFTYYSAFFFIPAFIGATDPISSMSPYAALILFSIIAAAILILTEILLIKKGIILKWKRETFGRVANSVLSLTLAAVLLTGSAILNLGYPYKDIICDAAEYTEFQTIEEFIDYIEKDVPVPDEKSSIQDKFTAYTNIGEMHFLPLWGISENPVFFNWNNGEVCRIVSTDEDIVPIKCYTHQALIEAENKTETKIFVTRTVLFMLYPLSVAISVCVYFAIKKKLKIG